HGLSDADFDTLFTVDKPVIFNFHGYPWLIHRLAYRRTNHKNLHVRGYKEHGNVIKRVPKLQGIGAHARERFLNEQIACRNYAFAHGTDKPEAAGWKWPY